jgi:hypothetical protein
MYLQQDISCRNWGVTPLSSLMVPGSRLLLTSLCFGHNSCFRQGFGTRLSPARPLTDEIKIFGPKSTKRGTLNFFFQPQKVKHREKNANILSIDVFLWVSSQKKKETNHKKFLGSRRG